jgi:cytochrome c
LRNNGPHSRAKDDVVKTPSLPFAAVLLSALVLVAVRSGIAQVTTSPDDVVTQGQGGTQNAVGVRRLGIGRAATPEEIAGWDIDIRPDGQGLPPGRGSVKDGEALFTQRCAGCHGDFGEGVGRWPVLAGGAATLTDDRPVKTIGAFWPYASTLLDYVRRAQPFGNAQSLNNDELYAVVAYLLFLNDIVDQNFVLTRDTYHNIKMPNEAGFHDDDREAAERAFWNPNPCMTDCKTDVQVTARAQSIDATPTDGSQRRGE